MIAIETEYRRRLLERQAALAAKDRVHAGYAWARLAVFGAGVAIFFIAGRQHLNWLLAPGAAFLVLAIAHARLLNARDRARSAVGFYERGLARVTHRWIGRGRDGLHLLPPSPEAHPYAIDLDLFGRGSLFELLATVRTHAGEETLARWLLEPAAPAEARARQDAVRELAARLDLREHVAVLGDEVRVAVHAGLLRRWATTPIALKGTHIRVALLLISMTTAGVLLWWMRTGHWAAILAIVALVQMAVVRLFQSRVSAVIEAVEEPAHDLALLAELVATLERQRFSASCLQDLQARIASSGRTASAEIRALSRLVAMLQSRNNVMFAIPAGIVMWATQWAFAIEAWRSRAGVRIPEWLDVIGEFEALLALSAFSAEHPEYVFPELADAGQAAASIAAAEMAHPVLGPEAVANSISLGGSPGRRTLGEGGPALLIVSGSNMSGKSTLLRAVGVNVVLANMGAPVRAVSFRLTPLAIGASIRVVDSLTDGRSRFMAEITRLKAIVDLAGDCVPPHPLTPSLAGASSPRSAPATHSLSLVRASGSSRSAVLFLLDEILSGTNSHDRRVGAEALINALLRTGAIGLVTTHDLALGEIATRMPDKAGNVHFVDEFRDGALYFDYKLRSGIVQSSNALALMRSIGIDV
jgi:hypothetical protein